MCIVFSVLFANRFDAECNLLCFPHNPKKKKKSSYTRLKKWAMCSSTSLKLTSNHKVIISQLLRVITVCGFFAVAKRARYDEEKCKFFLLHFQRGARALWCCSQHRSIERSDDSNSQGIRLPTHALLFTVVHLVLMCDYYWTSQRSK